MTLCSAPACAEAVLRRYRCFMIGHRSQFRAGAAAHPWAAEHIRSHARSARARLGLARQRLRRAVRAHPCPAGSTRGGCADSCGGADPGQRHVCGRGCGGNAGASRRPAAGAGQRRLWTPHRRDRAPARPALAWCWKRRKTGRSTRRRWQRALAADATLSDVALVHCETTSGLLNPLAAIADGGPACRTTPARRCDELVRRRPDRWRHGPFTALIGSANKGLEGVPGLGFVIADTAHLGACEGNSMSLSLDLWEQWRGFETTGQWRFTPAGAGRGGVGRGTRPAGRARRRRRPPCAIQQQLRAAGPRHARLRLHAVSRPGDPGAGDRHLCHPGRRLVRVRAVSTAFSPNAAWSSIRAS